MMIFIVLTTLTSIIMAEDVKTLELGSKAPNFNLIGTDDEYYTLDSFKDSELLCIIFLANHCPTSQAYEDRIFKIVNDFRGKVQVVGISSNNPDAVRLDEMSYTDVGDSFEDMKIRVAMKKYNFPYLYDGDEQKALRLYGAMATPHVFLFDNERSLRFVGRIDDAENIEKVTTSDTRNAIDALLEGKPVPVEKTRAFGCSMKWASKISGAENAIEKWNKETVELNTASIDEIEKLIKNDSDNLRVINFWATWCGPCRTEFPSLVEINRIYRVRNFEMITISLDSPSKDKDVLKFLKEHYASTINILYNSDNKYSLIEKVDDDWPGAIPYTLVIEPGGKIIFKKIGMIDSLELKTVIVESLGRYYE